MHYETFCQMKVPEIKTFLKPRVLKVSGKKCELIARVFSAVENKVQVVMPAEEVECELSREYKSKISVNESESGSFLVGKRLRIRRRGHQKHATHATFYILNFLMID